MTDKKNPFDPHKASDDARDARSWALAPAEAFIALMKQNPMKAHHALTSILSIAEMLNINEWQGDLVTERAILARASGSPLLTKLAAITGQDAGLPALASAAFDEGRRLSAAVGEDIGMLMQVVTIIDLMDELRIGRVPKESMSSDARAAFARTLTRVASRLMCLAAELHAGDAHALGVGMVDGDLSPAETNRLVDATTDAFSTMNVLVAAAIDLTEKQHAKARAASSPVGTPIEMTDSVRDFLSGLGLDPEAIEAVRVLFPMRGKGETA